MKKIIVKLDFFFLKIEKSSMQISLVSNLKSQIEVSFVLLFLSYLSFG